MSCSQSDSCIPVRREESGWGVLEEGGGWMGVLSRDATSSQCVKSIFSSVNRGIPAHWSWLCSQGFEVGDCQSVRCWMWMNNTCIKPFLSASTVTPLPSPRPVIMNTAHCTVLLYMHSHATSFMFLTEKSVSVFFQHCNHTVMNLPSLASIFVHTHSSPGIIRAHSCQYPWLFCN